MIPPLRRWGASHLLGAWIAYWVVLALAVLARPALVAWGIRGIGEGRANASASFGNGAFDIKMVADNVTVYQGHATYGVVLLWLIVPPLLIWVVWLVARPRPVPSAPGRPGELSAGDPLAGRESRGRAKSGSERGS